MVLFRRGVIMELMDKYFYSVLKFVRDAVIGIDEKGVIILMNGLAEKLLKINLEDCRGKRIDQVISYSELLRVLKTEKEELNQYFSKGDRQFIVDRIPILDQGKPRGALAIFHDITDYERMSKKIDEDEGYIDILNTILDTINERVVVVDEKAVITMMSKAYKEFIHVTNPEGRHVTEVIENTRLHRVLETGIMEVGEIQEIMGNKVIAMRIPLKKHGKVIGAIGKVMFSDVGDLMNLSKKINKLEEELQYYKEELKGERLAKYFFTDIVGNSPAFKAAKEMGRKVAKTDSNVLILGESGTGKELFAHSIHNASNRCYGPFVKINCAAIPSELLESELFGYEKGAFTGANTNGKKGKFEVAHGGTILLDEIGDMPLSMQAKLLRVIQEKEVERLGGNITRSIDVRIIASTNKDLENLVDRGKFRKDLYYRLSVRPIKLPHLRERKEYIRALTNALRIKVANRLGIYVEGISKDAIQYLEAHDWHGNIRELENIIERAINLLDSDLIIKPKHLPSKLTKDKYRVAYRNHRNLKNIVEEVEKEVIAECLIETRGNKNKTAKILGISRVALYKKIERYSLETIK